MVHFTVLLLSAVAFDRAIYYYYLLLLCRLFKIVYLKQTTFLGNVMLQLFCSYNLLYIIFRPMLVRMLCSLKQ